jgi:cytochrome c nitrite reductase small subunit
MVSNESPSPPLPPSDPPPERSSRAFFRSGVHFANIAIIALFGVSFGLGIYTFAYARGFSYFYDDPAACVNCHIMNEQFDAWTHSSHKAVAACNDCHTPHRFPDKWIIKGINGWNHGFAFTTGNFPEPIMIRGFNARIAQENCVDCHATTVAQMHHFVSPEGLYCVDCHGNVGHGNPPDARRTVVLPLPLTELADDQATTETEQDE